MAAPRLTLHDIGEEQAVLDQFLVETEGEETPEIADLMGQLSGTRMQKVDSWAAWIQSRSAEAAFLREEEVRLAARRRALENAVERSKRQLQTELELQGFPNGLRGLKYSAGIQNNSPGVAGEVDADTLARWEHDEFLGSFVRVKVSRELDKKALLARFSPGDVLPGGLAITVTRTLRIR